MKARILSLLLLIGGAVAIYTLCRSTYSLIKKGELFVQKEKELAVLKKKSQELKEGLRRTQSEEFIEKEAREKLNMGKRGEVVVILPKFKIQSSKFKVEEESPNWKKWYNFIFLPEEKDGGSSEISGE